MWLRQEGPEFEINASFNSILKFRPPQDTHQNPFSKQNKTKQYTSKMHEKPVSISPFYCTVKYYKLPSNHLSLNFQVT